MAVARRCRSTTFSSLRSGPSPSPSRTTGCRWSPFWSRRSSAATSRPPPGARAIAVERAQFLEEREAAEVERQRGELASTLLASLSHDLKTPLTVIRMAVDNLRDDLPVESAARPGRRRCGGVAPADAAVREHPRYGADRCRRAARAPRMGHARRHRRRGDGACPARGRRPRAFASTPTPTHVVNIDARLAVVALAHLIENAARYSPADRDDRRRGARRADGLERHRDRSRSRARRGRDRSSVRAVLPRPTRSAHRAREPAWDWPSPAAC